ncbi:hypothetical protein C0995_005247 [Termitomyces sp. Mi166|nr:hypothetical protein C0995_005247 [Termitomyces sp. Mi166\
MKAPKARSKRDSDHIPRPPNSFILFGQHHRQIKDIPGDARDQAKALGEMWAEAKPEVRAEFERQAEIAKQKHTEEFPGYEYRPQTKTMKRAKDKQRRQEALQRKLAKSRTELGGASSDSNSDLDVEDALPRARLPYPLIPSEDASDCGASSVSSPTSSGPPTPHLLFAAPSIINSDAPRGEHIGDVATNKVSDMPAYNLHKSAGQSAQPRPDAAQLVDQWYCQGGTLETFDAYLQELIVTAKLREAQRGAIPSSRQPDFNPVNIYGNVEAGYELHSADVGMYMIDRADAITTASGTGLRKQFSASEWFNFNEATENC